MIKPEQSSDAYPKSGRSRGTGNAIAERCEALAAHLEARQEKGARLSAASCVLAAIALRTFVMAVKDRPAHAFNFRVDAGPDIAKAANEPIATCDSLMVAIAAYEAAVLARPSQYVCLRQGIRIIRQSHELSLPDPHSRG